MPKFKVWQPTGSPDGGDVSAVTKAVETSVVTTMEPEAVVEAPVDTETRPEHEANSQASAVDDARTAASYELPAINEVSVAAAAAAAAGGGVDSKEMGEEAPAEIAAEHTASRVSNDKPPCITQQQEHVENEARSRAASAGPTHLNAPLEVKLPSVDAPVVKIDDPSVEVVPGVAKVDEASGQPHENDNNRNAVAAEEDTSQEVVSPPPPPTTEDAVVQHADAAAAEPLGNDEASDNPEPAASPCPMPVRDSMFVMAPHPLMVGRPAEGGRPMGGRPIDNTTQESKEDCIIS